MADENAKNAAVEAVKEETVDVPADKSKTVIMALIILSVLVMVLTPFVTIFVVKAMMPQNQESAAEENPATQKGAEITFEPFRTNIANTQGSKYAEIVVAVELRDANMEKYFKKRTAEIPEGMLNQIRAKITSIISSKTLSGLLSQDAQTALQSEIKTSLNNIFEKKREAGDKSIKQEEVVKEVYFPSFLVQ